MPRLSLNSLAQLSRRVSTSLKAGIDLRKVWKQEADRAGGMATREPLQAISNALRNGQSLKDAMDATGDFFPPLVREMVAVGDETGRLAEVFSDLARHFESQLKVRRMFLGAITWPLTELGIAILLVAVLIWATGYIARTSGTSVDILGLGLVGTQGLIIYFTFLAVIGGSLIFTVRALRRGTLWTQTIEQWADYTPCVGNAVRALALSRFAWSLEMTMGAGMEVHRALRLALQSSQYSRFIAASAMIDASLTAGQSVHDALVASQAFPQDFLDAFEVGEQGGATVETLERLSRQYRATAESAIATLAKVASYLVWAFVAMLIIMVIFRIAHFYLSMLSQAGGL